MKGYYAFTKKELLEQLRTFKWLIILSVFFLFGMMSPVLAKLMPDILSGMEVEGMKIVIPDPTAMDAYGQFFKNFTQMGILVVLLVFGGTLSNELVRGTLVNILAKGMPRPVVILSKYTAAVLLWTVGYLLAAATTFGYTAYLFKDALVSNLVFSMFCLWLFGIFVLALVFLSSTIASGNFGGLVLSAVALILMLMIGVIPNTEKYNPVTLASVNVALLSGTKEVKDLIATVIITCLLTVGCMIGSIVLFGKKKL
ncbi:MAG TPA: ABC transporter permease [Mobilitalea sp.]|nr:ABC transporter permease [Mobilitalea sp.]